MSIWRARAGQPGRRQCRRCGKAFLPRKEGQEYGPKCARKLAGQVALDSQALVSGKVLRKKETAEEHRKCRICGCTQSMPCAGGCAWVEPDLCSACTMEKAVLA